jgi:hypothetical protein
LKHKPGFNFSSAQEREDIFPPAISRYVPELPATGQRWTLDAVV